MTGLPGLLGNMCGVWREAMKTNELDAHAMEDPEGRLETMLIEEFLRARGLGPATVHALPEVEAKRVLTEASAYAAAKLAEIEARAHFVHEIHGWE
jgi:hypothetical protein